MPHLEWKFIVIELPVTFLSFGCLYLGKCWKWSVILQAGFPHISFTATPWFVCLLYSLPSNIFYWVLFSFYRTPEDRTRLPLNLHSWKNDLSQTNCLVFVVFLMYNFHLSLAALYYFVGRRKNYPISSFWLVLRVLLVFIFWCFLKCYLL